MLPKPKGILFDLDGTLIDSIPLSFEAFNAGVRAAGTRDFQSHEIRKYFGMGELQIFENLMGPVKAKVAFEAARAFFEANLDRLPLHPGINELLEQIEFAGLQLGLVTGRGSIITKTILEYHQLGARLGVVVTNDDVPRPKPAPDGLLLASQKLGISIDRLVYIGDSELDIRAARACKMSSIGALWDKTVSHDLLLQEGPSATAQSPSEVATSLFQGI